MSTKAKPKVVVTNWVHPEVLNFLEDEFIVVANKTRQPWTKEIVQEMSKNAAALITFMTDKVDDPFLDNCPQLRIIACALKGYDNFDIAACERRGVQVTFIPDLLTAPTAELTIGLMIGIGRHILEGDQFVRSGDFQGWRPRLYGTGLDQSRVGICGMGELGKAIVLRLQGFNASLTYWDRKRLSPLEEKYLRLSFMDLDALTAENDYLVLALPLSNATFHLFDADRIASIKAGSILVNVSRGSIVDENAVANALDARHLGGYASDVFEMEDWAREERPREILTKLLEMPKKTLFTPHVGSAVDRVRLEIAMAAAISIKNHFLDANIHTNSQTLTTIEECAQEKTA